MPRLDVSGVGVVGADGTARVTLTPLRAFESWLVRSCSITCSSAAVSRFELLIGSSRANSTEYGNLNTDAQMNEVVQNGQPIVGVWSRADPGSTVSMTLRGETTRDGVQ